MWELLPLLADRPSVSWHLIPLALVVSLAYNASRYEDTRVILLRATRYMAMILLFMGLVFLVLLVLSYRL